MKLFRIKQLVNKLYERMNFLGESEFRFLVEFFCQTLPTSRPNFDKLEVSAKFVL